MRSGGALATRALTTRTLINGGLVALAGVGAWALVSTPEQRTVPAVVTTVDTARVCLTAEPGALCLDAEHVDHLRLGGLSPRDCVTVTYRGAWVDEGLTRVRPRPCAGA